MVTGEKLASEDRPRQGAPFLQDHPPSSAVASTGIWVTQGQGPGDWVKPSKFRKTLSCKCCSSRTVSLSTLSWLWWAGRVGEGRRAHRVGVQRVA